MNKQIIISSRPADEISTDCSFPSRLNHQKIIYKDDIKIVTEFPCLLGHPVSRVFINQGMTDLKEEAKKLSINNSCKINKNDIVSIRYEIINSIKCNFSCGV